MRYNRKISKTFPDPVFSAYIVILLAVMVAIYTYSLKDKKVYDYDIAIEDPGFYIKLRDSTWYRIDVGPFKIDVPVSYKYVKRIGIDSKVGEFCSPNDTIFFDFGWHSNNFSWFENKDNYIKEFITVSGRRAKLVYTKDSLGIVGLYIDNVTDMDKISISATSRRIDEKIKIMKSVKVDIRN